MIHALIVLLMLALWPAAAESACINQGGGKWLAESWPADVNTCYANASNGDTITVGAGTHNATTTAVLLESGKPVTLQGAGTIPTGCDPSTGTGCGAATSGGTTVVVNSSGLTAAIGITESRIGHIILRNIKFTTDSAKNTPQFGIVVVNERIASGKPVVIDHITVDFTDKVNFSPGSRTAVLSAASRGVVSNSIFTGQAPGVSTAYITNRAALDCKRNNPSDNWSRPHTMGTADATGFNNIYFETNRIEFFNDAIDHSDGCRLVNRFNRYRNSTSKGHGADSGFGARHFEHYNNTHECVVGVTANVPYWLFQRGGTGIVTDNVFPTITAECQTFNSGSTSSVVAQIFRLTQNTSTHCWPTEPITSLTRSASTATLVVPSAHGMSNGHKVHVYGVNNDSGQRFSPFNVVAATVTVVNSTTVTFTITPTGTTPTTAAGANIVYVSHAHAIAANSYPVVRQIGWGWITGSSSTSYEGNFVQDLEPTYIWNNTGMASANTIIPNDAGSDSCGYARTTAQYFQQGREWFASARPSYAKKQYPHPLVPADGGGGGSTDGRGIRLRR